MGGIDRRHFLFGAGAALIVAPSVGGFLRKLFTGSRLKKMTWYRIWEGWDDKGNSVPLLAEGEAAPIAKGFTPIRAVYVFRTNRHRQVAQVLNRTQIPQRPVTYESQHWALPRPKKMFRGYGGYEPYEPFEIGEFFKGATPQEKALHTFVQKLVA